MAQLEHFQWELLFIEAIIQKLLSVCCINRFNHETQGI